MRSGRPWLCKTATTERTMTDFLTPEEADKRRQQSKNRKPKVPVSAFEETKAENEDGIVEETAINYGQSVKIDLESGGRFTLPPTVYFYDYTVEDVNDFVTTRPEHLLETLIAILEKKKNIQATGQDFYVGDATIEEFYEILVAMKLQFDSPMLTHHWHCECQDQELDKDKKLSSQEVDLREGQSVSIENIEEEFRQKYRTFLENLSDADWSQFTRQKFGPDMEMTREDFLSNLQIQEPINIPANGKIYQFHFIRIKTFVEAQKLAEKKYDNLIRITNSKKFPGSKEEARASREAEVESINEKKGREIVKLSQALSLISVDRGKPIKSASEKMEIYNKLPPRAMQSLFETFENCKGYGFQMEFLSQCNLEGCEVKKQRLLHREWTPIHLFPIPDNTGDDTRHRLSKSAGFDVFFG